MSNYPLSVVLSFVEKMNEWEHKMYLVSRVESGGVLNHEKDKALLPSVSADEFQNEYYKVFDAHCTKRKRTYGGFPGGWSKNGQYQGVDAETIERVLEVRKDRVEIVARGGLFPRNKFLFVVFKTKDGWRIDSAKKGGESDWSVHYL